MPRPRGLPKTGGRKSGSKNKRLGNAAEIFDRLAFNSLEKAIELIRDESLEIQYRIGLLKEVLKFQFPQLRSVEHSGTAHQVVIEDRRNQLIQVLSDPVALEAAKAIAERLNREEEKGEQSNAQ
jgi:hypothetical protein